MRDNEPSVRSTGETVISPVERKVVQLSPEGVLDELRKLDVLPTGSESGGSASRAYRRPP